MACENDCLSNCQGTLGNLCWTTDNLDENLKIASVYKCYLQCKEMLMECTCVLSGRSTFCVLADKSSLKVRNIIAKGVYDIVHTNWLHRCIDQQRLLKW